MAKVRPTQPGSVSEDLALLVPRELKVEPHPHRLTFPAVNVSVFYQRVDTASAAWPTRRGPAAGTFPGSARLGRFPERWPAVSLAGKTSFQRFKAINSR
jgi:hypothetical protein